MSIDSAARIIRISRNVADLELSAAFYVHRLGFRALSAPQFDDELGALLGVPGVRFRTQRLRFGEQEIELVELGKEVSLYPPNSTSADIWFQHFALRVHDIAAACRRLFNDNVCAPRPTAISHDNNETAAPITLPPHSGGITAFKFRDPDGHPLELIQFRENRGQLRDEGIDHSAISVANAEASIKFYTEIFGVRVAHRQLNIGIEQQCLDGLERSTVEVIGLMPGVDDGAIASPHLELLAYQIPRGRFISPTTTPFDIASDRLVLHVKHLDETAKLNKDRLPVISSLGNTRCLLTRDPDGHFLQLIE